MCVEAGALLLLSGGEGDVSVPIRLIFGETKRREGRMKQGSSEATDQDKDADADNDKGAGVPPNA